LDESDVAPYIGAQTVNVEGQMVFRQVLHTTPIGASCLFGCGGQGQSVVVDPVQDIGAYLDASRETAVFHDWLRAAIQPGVRDGGPEREVVWL
jgi:hypothetical protein